MKNHTDMVTPYEPTTIAGTSDEISYQASRLDEIMYKAIQSLVFGEG
jgi:hypothetical protein